MALLTSLNAYWSMEGNSNDSTANANNGSDTSISYSSGNGKVSQGAGFNGTTSKIGLTNSASLKPTTSFSIAAWFKKNGTPSTVGVILQNFSWFTNFSGFQFKIEVSGKVTLQSFRNTGTTSGTDYQTVTGNTNVCDDAWHLLIGIWDGSQLHVYVDNVEDATAVNWSNAPGYATTTYPQLGVYNESGTDTFFTAMNLDEVGLWSKVLSSTERTELWGSGNGTTYPFSGVSPSSSLSPSSSISPSISPSSSISSSPSASTSPSSSRSPSASVSPSSSFSSSISPSSSLSASISPSPSSGYAVYSRGDEAFLPTNTTDLETIYSEAEEVKVESANGIRVGQEGTLEYMIHQFKTFVGSQNYATILWQGQSSLSPQYSTVYLQVFNWNTNQWETVDTDNDSDPEIDFELHATITNLTNYKDGSNVVSCRVYQLAI